MLLCQNGRTSVGVARRVDALSDSGHPATADAGTCDLGIDYARYGAGEEALAWLDAEVKVSPQPREAPAKPYAAWYARSSPKSATGRMRSAT